MVDDGDHLTVPQEDPQLESEVAEPYGSDESLRIFRSKLVYHQGLRWGERVPYLYGRRRKEPNDDGHHDLLNTLELNP